MKLKSNCESSACNLLQSCSLSFQKTHLHKSQYLQPLEAETSDGIQSSRFTIPGSEHDTTANEMVPTVKNSKHIKHDVGFISA